MLVSPYRARQKTDTTIANPSVTPGWPGLWESHGKSEFLASFAPINHNFRRTFSQVSHTNESPRQHNKQRGEYLFVIYRWGWRGCVQGEARPGDIPALAQISSRVSPSLVSSQGDSTVYNISFIFPSPSPGYKTLLSVSANETENIYTALKYLRCLGQILCYFLDKSSNYCRSLSSRGGAIEKQYTEHATTFGTFTLFTADKLVILIKWDNFLPLAPLSMSILIPSSSPPLTFHCCPDWYLLFICLQSDNGQFVGKARTTDV